jgi:hypothetical protein
LVIPTTTSKNNPQRLFMIEWSDGSKSPMVADAPEHSERGTAETNNSYQSVIQKWRTKGHLELEPEWPDPKNKKRKKTRKMQYKLSVINLVPPTSSEVLRLDIQLQETSRKSKSQSGA